MPCIPVQTVDELIKTLGGLASAREVLGGTPQMIANWRTRGIPARLYLAHRKALSDRNIEAPPSLWGMEESAASEAAE